jgi:DNA-binding NarL/FixJ family response regulator
MSLTRALKVLIADDSVSVSDMLTDLISDPGRLEVVGVADSEKSAVEKITQLMPDAVIIDMQLKSGNGAGVIRAVRASPALRGIKCIVMSNHTSPQTRKACMDLGADFFFDKSKDFDRLLETLQSLQA